MPTCPPCPQALALDGPRLHPDSAIKRGLADADRAFVALFALEAALKIIALGFALHEGSYSE
jgi:hypothetical protein